MGSGREIVDLSMQHILACDTAGAGCGGGQMGQAFDWVAQNGVPSLNDEPYLCEDRSSSECESMTCSSCTKRTGETCIFGKLFGGCKVEGAVCQHQGLIHHCECSSDQCFRDGQCSADQPVALVLAPGDVAHHTDVDQTEMALEAAVAQQPVTV